MGRVGDRNGRESRFSQLEAGRKALGCQVLKRQNPLSGVLKHRTGRCNVRLTTERGAIMHAQGAHINSPILSRQDARSRMAETGQSVRKPLFRAPAHPLRPGHEWNPAERRGRTILRRGPEYRMGNQRERGLFMPKIHET
jgi:hypothetical protein